MEETEKIFDKNKNVFFQIHSLIKLRLSSKYSYWEGGGISRILRVVSYTPVLTPI